MMDPALRNELMRFHTEHMRRVAEHHRSTRRTESPRRPDREHQER